MVTSSLVAGHHALRPVRAGVSSRRAARGRPRMLRQCVHPVSPSSASALETRSLPSGERAVPGLLHIGRYGQKAFFHAARPSDLPVGWRVCAGRRQLGRYVPAMVSRRGLQVVLAVLGMVAVASGLYGMLAGPAALPGAGPVDATVDSEYRFT